LFENVLNTIRKKFPETPVFWIAITPTGSRWKAWPQIHKANIQIQKVCQEHENTWFISTKKFFLNAEGHPKDELFQSDRLHLNKEGYAVWKGIIKKELEKVIGDQ